MKSSQSTGKSPAKKSRPQSKNDQEENQRFPIVGIGASAGGLEAFTHLLSHLSTDTGMAFVLIQHLSPNQKSLLTEILARTTQMPVHEAQNGMIVEPNNIYVIPPNQIMTIVKGNLQLKPRQKNHLITMTINIFFNSLAQDAGNHAIGILLSGASEDGTEGLKNIKAVGGITFAQQEEPGMVNTMPNSAINAGCVDFILFPDKIAETLNNINDIDLQTLQQQAVQITKTNPVVVNLEITDPLFTIFKLLREKTGVDFTGYKSNTLTRRINRRIKANKLDNIQDYAVYIQLHSAEVGQLFQDLLISVTSFFRDPEAFNILKTKVFPIITKNRSRENPIRIWTAGCSTGEEAYSIAICLLEFCTENNLILPIQVFATDVNEVLIEKARIGIYKYNQISSIPPHRLQRFFTKVESGYQISKSVREICIFARHNLINDPPLSRMDLITCRNLLIYLDSPVQKKILQILHYALKSKGFLFLGTSETISDFPSLFTIEEKKYKIYRRNDISQEQKIQLLPSQFISEYVNIRPSVDNDFMEIEIYKEADRIVLNQFTPVGVVIDENWDILQFRGETNRYLQPAPGKPTFNVLKMSRQELKLDLRSAIHEARIEQKAIKKEGIHIREKDLVRVVTIDVIPFRVSGSKKDFYLILFQDTSSIVISEAKSNQNIQFNQPQNNNHEQEISVLKQELKTTKDYMQSVIEEQQSTNQDLRAANEEILSSNEELQSTNEELETAKEEIQASNEELNTINDELQRRNLEANQISSDLQNLLTSINIAILMLGGDLRIRRFTPTAQLIFNLIPGDLERPLSDLKHKLKIENLEAQILEVIKTLNVITQEVEDDHGNWYNLSIRPYRTIDHKIDGVVLVLVDISEVKSSSEKIRASRDYAEAIVNTVRQSLLVLDQNLRVITANQFFYDKFQLSQAETEKYLIYELDHGEWNIPELRSLLERILPNQTQFTNLEIEHTFEKIGSKILYLNARKLMLENQQLILLAIDDVTQEKQLELERTQLLAQMEKANRAKDDFLSILSHELRNPLNSLLGWTKLLQQKRLDETKTNQALAAIERSVKTQNLLIGDLLDISRISSGRLRLDIQPVKLIPLISAAIEMINLDAEQKNIQIQSQLDPANKTLQADPIRLQQVIWNLLSNSIKFTPAGGRINITLNYTDNEAEAEIQVQDTGIGINAEFLPHIFERFRQLDSSTSKSNLGLGLGLAIVRHLVELHGGTITAASPGEGQGTTFTIRLPVEINQQQSKLDISASVDSNLQESNLQESIDNNTPEVGNRNIPSLAGLRVLIVEDQADICQLFQIVLEEHGVEVTVATSAPEALSILTENPNGHDVLLSDLGMPNEDGYSLIRQLRALSEEQGGQIPAAALTGYTGEKELSEALTAGFQRYITKPVDSDQLLSVVADLAGRSTGNSEQ
jgi:two-component system CheB/CheR fusion protein